MRKVGYNDRSAFANVTTVIFPSEYSRRHHNRLLGIDGPVIPDPIPLDREIADVERAVSEGTYEGLFDPLSDRDDPGGTRMEFGILDETAGRCIMMQERASERGLMRLASSPAPPATRGQNPSGRLMSESWLTSSGGTVLTINSGYDNMGRLTSVSDPYASLTFTHLCTVQPQFGRCATRSRGGVARSVAGPGSRRCAA